MTTAVPVAPLLAIGEPSSHVAKASPPVIVGKHTDMLLLIQKLDQLKLTHTLHDSKYKAELCEAAAFEVKAAKAKNAATAAQHKAKYTSHTAKAMDAKASLDATSKLLSDLSGTINLTNAAVTKSIADVGNQHFVESAGSAGDDVTKSIAEVGEQHFVESAGSAGDDVTTSIAEAGQQHFAEFAGDAVTPSIGEVGNAAVLVKFLTDVPKDAPLSAGALEAHNAAATKI